MSRREELQKEVDLLQQRIDNAPADTPEYVMNAWKVAYNDLAFDLNNLYDDDEIKDLNDQS